MAEAGGLPLCIYNNPSTTKFTFSDDLIARLAKLPNVAAVKMPLPANGDFAGEMERLRAITPKGFAIGYSGDWGAADTLLSGCDAWYSRRKRATVRKPTRINDAFQPLWDLFRAFGSFRVMYVIADLLGFARIEPPRPILALPQETRSRVEGALQNLKSVGSFLP